MTELDTRPRPAGALAVTDGQTGWTEHQRAALVQIGVGDAPLGDQLVLLHQAQRTGLDPFAKQIYMIGRKQKESEKVGNAWVDRYVVKWSIQTGIDGYRVIARRTADRLGETLGYDDTVWCAEDGVWRDVWLASDPPAAAKVTVIRNGERFWAVARFESYAQTKSAGGLTKQWATMPDVMIAKCAEALALRKAYPQDLAGIYTDEEMGQADNPVDITHTTTVSPGGTPHRSDAERQQWRDRWEERFALAPDVATLEVLGQVVNRAVISGHADETTRSELRDLLRARAAELHTPTPPVEVDADGEAIPDDAGVSPEELARYEQGAQ